MEKYGLHISRTSQDRKKNTHGYKLIDVCKNYNLFVLNGIFGKDKGIGKMTFRNISVIDYKISSLKGYTLPTDSSIF